jgi:nitrite reductase/ring-hydroxylating ferredoxin subunit
VAKWIDIGKLEDFPVGEKICLDVDGQGLVICRLAAGTPGMPQGGVCAVVNMCPHAGLPLGEGELSGGVLTCPFHGYAFNVATGRNIDYPDDTPASVLPVRVMAHRVEIDLEPENV